MNTRGKSFQDTFYSFMLLGLLVLALLSSSFIIQEDNDAPQPLASNPLFNQTATSLNESISSAEASGQIQQGIFSEEKPREGFGSIVLFGVVSAGKTFTNVTYDILGLTFRIPMVVLGINSEIVSAFISILVITIIIGLWIVYKLGG